MRIVASGALLALFSVVVPAFPQDTAQPAKARYVSVVGAIEKVDSAGKVLTVKPDKSDAAVIKFDDKTQFLRLPAGETDTKKATRGAAGDVAVGDRAVARLKAEDQTQPAVFFYFTKQTDLAQRQQKTAEEWQTQSVAGSVKSVDAAAKHILISVRGGFGPPKDVTLDATGTVDFQRYSGDSGKYEPSALAAIQTGDQVRVLGKKNPDQTEIKLDAIMSGAFKSLPVQIKTVDAATGTITATDLASKKPITISVKPDTTMKRLDDATALLMARRLNPSFQAAAGAGRGAGRGERPAGGNAEAPPAGAGTAPGGAPGGNLAAGGFGGGRGGPGAGRAGRGGRNADPNNLLDQQPSIEIADLKPGEPIVVTGAASNDMSKVTAMTVVAGVDPILRAAPQNGPDPLGGNWNFGDIGAPQ